MNSLRHWRVGALLSLFLLPAFANSAAAQVIVGNDLRPQVEVDSSVLDRLGNEPTLPDLFLGRAAQPGNSPASESPSGQAPKLRRPPHSVVLRKPIHREVKSKETAAASKKPSPPQVAAAITAPAAKANAKPVETPKATAKPNSPAVSLPVLAPTEPQPTNGADSKSDAKPDNKAETTTENKVEPQPEPSVAPKPPTAATPPDNPAPSASAMPSQPSSPPSAGQMATGTMPARPAAPEPSVPAPVAAAPALPAVTVPTLAPPAHEPQEAHLAPTAPTTPPAPAATPSGSIEPPLTILFETDSAQLPDTVRTSLSQLTDRLSSDSALQIQILAYAEGDEENASKARRLSLSRALAVRSVLIDQGVRSTRIEVRALGNKIPEGPADRVDVLLQKR